jgi:hypothetical protein
MNDRLKALLVGALVAVVVAGCGGDDDEDTSSGSGVPDAAVDAFFTGLVAGDGEATCGALSSQAQEDPPFPLSLGFVEGGTCEEAVSLLASTNSESELENTYGSLETEVTDESADEATVRTLDAGDPFYDYTVVNEDGAWKIDSSVLATGK